MSRILLSIHPNTDEPELVVGWDRPMRTFFWQVFNAEPRNERGEVDWNCEAAQSWEEVSGFGGYMNGEIPTIEHLREAMPERFRDVMNVEELRAMLDDHQSEMTNPNVNRDLSGRPEIVKVIEAARASS